jgi:type I restriction enzyme S subunit
VREGWQSKALADACEIKPPKSEAKRRLKDFDLVSFAPMEDLGIDRKFLEPKAERALAQVAGSYTYFADGDVLLAKITPCFENGKLGIARRLTNGIGFGSSEYIVFRPSSELSSEYLYYFLLQDGFRAEGVKSMSGAVGHKRVSKDFIERFKIPLPPLPEQQRIVAILDEAFAGLATATANAEKNLKNAREMFENYLASVFNKEGDGWSKKTIGDVGDLISGQHIDAKDYNMKGRGLAYLTGPSDFGALHPVISKWTEAPKRKAIKGDILVTVKGSGVGSINLLDTAEVAISRQLMAVRSHGVSRDFLYFFLSVQQKHFRSLAKGAAIPGISREDVLDLSIAMPARATQDGLVLEIKTLEEHVLELEDHYRSRISEISELRQSLLQKAFSGELTKSVTDLRNASVANVRRDTALVIALAYERHKRKKRDWSFGHTKEQKILHMVEAEGGFDLRRQPIRAQAGPNDFRHMLDAEEWAEANQYFKISERADGGYQFHALARYAELRSLADSLDTAVRKKIECIIDVFVPMDMRQAEVFATVYAAWNNLIIDGKSPTDEAIIEACYAWHPKKAEIARSKFVEALRHIRDSRMQPTGRASYVPPPAQGQLL